MKQTALAVALVSLIVLLAGILVLLVQITRHGLTINVTGVVSLADAGVSGEVTLVMPEAINLIATGPENGPVSGTIALLSCSQCGESMLPVRFNLFTGEIEWRCTGCGHTNEGSPSP